MLMRVRRVGGVISTDDITPARYKHSTVDPAELATHLFEFYLDAADRAFELGDCIVADSIFGIGSSREQAVSALLAAGVTAVIAPAFGRIFFRNAWNLGLPAIELTPRDLAQNSMVELDLAGGWLRVGNESIRLAPISAEMLEMHMAGGLIAQLRTRATEVACRT